MCHFCVTGLFRVLFQGYSQGVLTPVVELSVDLEREQEENSRLCPDRYLVD